MPKFRIWFDITERYCVDVESETLEGAMDQVHENPPIHRRDSFVSSHVEIEGWVEVNG